MDDFSAVTIPFIRTPAAFVAELSERSSLLFWLTAAHLALAVALGILLLADNSVQVMGINRWGKPLKFAISIALFLGTMAWLLPDLLPGHLARAFAWAFAILMVAEIVPIVWQAARGVRSHFNTSSPIDGVVFGIMGLAAFSTILVAAAVLLVSLFHNTPTLPSAYIESLRWGLALFVLGSMIGGYMAAVNGGYSVGGADGGAGLPLLNWSRTHGDLRIAHFIGLHAIQIVPLTAAIALHMGSNALHWTRFIGASILLLFVWTLVGALARQPLLR